MVVRSLAPSPDAQSILPSEIWTLILELVIITEDSCVATRTLLAVSLVHYCTTRPFKDLR